MAAPAITDPFFRKLFNRLAEDIDNRVTSLARGSALIYNEFGGLDAIATAMKYQASVSYIEAQQAVIDLGVEIDHDHYGKRTNGDD